MATSDLAAVVSGDDWLARLRFSENVQAQVGQKLAERQFATVADLLAARLTEADLCDLGLTCFCDRRRALKSLRAFQLNVPIREWLRALGLEQYADRFLAEGYPTAFGLLDAHMRESDLIDCFGMDSADERARFLRAISLFPPETEAASIPVQDQAVAVGVATSVSTETAIDAMDVAALEAMSTMKQKAATRAQLQFDSVHDAVRAQSVEGVQEWLGVKPTCVKDVEKYKDTPLHVAADRSQVAIAQLLLNAQASVNIPNMWGSTPLHIASQRGNLDIVRLILAMQPKLNTKNEAGRTPLMCARAGGNDEVVLLLSQAGAT
mmetsp:Transcript_75636/g.177571  ORF Transcript_75636/g.177571 Transcript_75636/m.177571 type:complete len:321 (+) Transcript_75636:1-963(+)